MASRRSSPAAGQILPALALVLPLSRVAAAVRPLRRSEVLGPCVAAAAVPRPPPSRCRAVPCAVLRSLRIGPHGGNAARPASAPAAPYNPAPLRPLLAAS
ncbi:hypothetical protein FA09DRAFT_328295 [Tilletiopsis washingtonensis]|uniref:Uncharacterized protein n=1 Tax=Tilletiopsis washingtonensis TaxID=58919 RepID=A0A316ZGY7_9BASI|nr:hypothetical protein FA09DRAFT_328295 [Tilletiopsis washingtonensis]PWO00193.1 hypothetical protein FA09DRAFT_328295 [Tilletiopsis washingtonensis]